MSIATIDEKGRLVIPEDVRKKLRLKKGEKFLVVSVGDNTITLERLSIKELLSKMADEVARSGIDLEELEKRIEQEADAIARRKLQET